MSQPLTLLEAIRKRPPMYLGSTGRLGLAHLYAYVCRSAVARQQPVAGVA